MLVNGTSQDGCHSRVGAHDHDQCLDEAPEERDPCGHAICTGIVDGGYCQAYSFVGRQEGYRSTSPLSFFQKSLSPPASGPISFVFFLPTFVVLF